MQGKDTWPLRGSQCGYRKLGGGTWWVEGGAYARVLSVGIRGGRRAQAHRRAHLLSLGVEPLVVQLLLIEQVASFGLNELLLAVPLERSVAVEKPTTAAVARHRSLRCSRALFTVSEQRVAELSSRDVAQAVAGNRGFYWGAHAASCRQVRRGEKKGVRTKRDGLRHQFDPPRSLPFLLRICLQSRCGNGECGGDSDGLGRAEKANRTSPILWPILKYDLALQL